MKPGTASDSDNESIRSDRSDEKAGEKRKQKKEETIPDAVDHFLGQLQDALQVRNVVDLHKLYEETYNNLTTKHYKNSKWPSAEAVAKQLSIEEPSSSVFIILYKDLYYRHIYTRGNPNHEDRLGSYENYCKLLELFVDDLKNDHTLSVGLPVQWLWDILDEFVYHYQVYCMYRVKTTKKAVEADIAKIRDNPNVFETTKVLSYLHQLLKYSLVEEWLQNPSNPQNKGLAFTDELVRHTGYFAMMQLMRMHSLMGDYREALRTIQYVDFHAEVPFFYKTPACHIALYYYMGFAYLMMRRYADAAKTYSGILVYLSKTSGVNSLSSQYDFALKKQDQMFVLLLVCVALCPQSLDESLEKTIREKHAEKQARLHRGEILCFEELFSYACPKFVSPAPPVFDKLENFNPNEAHQRQLELFLQEVRQQQALPKIGACMKLYTSLTMRKLCQLCEMDEDGLRDQLMCVVHKTRQPVHSKGPPMDGKIVSCSDVEFYIDRDMVHINALKPQRPHAEVFLENILKSQDLLRKMGQM